MAEISNSSIFASLISKPHDISAKAQLFIPDLEECIPDLKEYLQSFFGEVLVEIVDCPDLTKSPFSLRSKSFGHCLKVASVGTENNLIPKVNNDKIYDLKITAEKCGSEGNKVFIFGPAFASEGAAGTHGLAIMDAVVEADDSQALPKVVSLNSETPELNTHTQPEFAIMGDLAISQENPESVPKVLHIRARKRAGLTSYTDAIRHFFEAHFEDRPISLVGVFTIQGGTVKVRVMPNLAESMEYENREKFEEGLEWRDIATPATCVSLLHINETPVMANRLTQTFCYNFENKTGGSYHLDNDPEAIDYEGYFAPAEYLYQIDQIPRI